MDAIDKDLIWLVDTVKTPPLSEAARIEAGHYLRLLQLGESLSMPISRPMPGIGKGCHELRVPDENLTWRIVYKIGKTRIVIGAVFEKKTQKTPGHVIKTCKKRYKDYGEF